MKLLDAENRFREIVGIRFGQLFSESDLNTIIINKGKSGQLLHLALGVPLNRKDFNFEDGELNSSKCDAYGNPQETVAIMQIKNIIDELLLIVPFEESQLYEKIKNILYVPVSKVGNPQDWFFLPCIHIDFSLPCYYELMEICRQDYYYICQQLRNQIETSPDSFIHTSSGNFIQVRSKDENRNGGYHSIYSNIYGRNISDKNYAFYFKKEFIHYIQNMNR